MILDLWVSYVLYSSLTLSTIGLIKVYMTF